MLAAFIVTALTDGTNGLRDLLARMGRCRVGWPWWLATFEFGGVLRPRPAADSAARWPVADLVPLGQIN
jgi:hypothetical protein